MPETGEEMKTNKQIIEETTRWVLKEDQRLQRFYKVRDMIKLSARKAIELYKESCQKQEIK
jgi:hypothetical protein